MLSIHQNNHNDGKREGYRLTVTYSNIKIKIANLIYDYHKDI